ncbi:MAG: carboxylesterase family protein [Flavisolibacter sp.]
MFKKTLAWLAVTLTVAISQSNAQQFINDKVDVIAGSNQFLMNMVIYKPSNYSSTKQYPLVMFFHGMGEAGTNVNRMYNTGLPKVLKDGYRPSFDFVMVAVQHNSYALDPDHLDQVLNESLKKVSNIDQSRIYLTGLSAGGTTIYKSQVNVNLELPKRFAGMVVMSGATGGISTANYPWWKTSKTPLWAVVGDNDISYRNQNISVVNQVNNQVAGLASITIRPGVGHGGWNDVYNGKVKTSDNKTMWEWLYQFSRSTTGEILVGNTATPPPPPPVVLPPTTGAKYIKVNLFSGFNPYNNSEWNNWNTKTSLSSAIFNYNDGSQSLVSAVISSQTNVSDNGSTYSTTMVSREVGRYTSYSTSKRTLTISGLENNRTYSLDIYSSRSGKSNNLTKFTVGNAIKEIKTDNNLTQTVTFNNLTPVNGKIVLNLASLKTYNYINGFSIY